MYDYIITYYNDSYLIKSNIILNAQDVIIIENVGSFYLGAKVNENTFSAMTVSNIICVQEENPTL